MNAIQIIKNGIVKENPTFVLMLGMCPTLATTTSAMNGMSMGLATMAVLICTNYPCFHRGDCGFCNNPATRHQGFPA